MASCKWQDGWIWRTVYHYEQQISAKNIYFLGMQAGVKEARIYEGRAIHWGAATAAATRGRGRLIRAVDKSDAGGDLGRVRQGDSVSYHSFIILSGAHVDWVGGARCLHGAYTGVGRDAMRTDPRMIRLARRVVFIHPRARVCRTPTAATTFYVCR